MRIDFPGGVSDECVEWLDMLIGLGWTRVMLTKFTDNTYAIDITHWLAENIKNPYERNGRDFLFENPKDASWFILRWI